MTRRRRPKSYPRWMATRWPVCRRSCGPKVPSPSQGLCPAQRAACIRQHCHRPVRRCKPPCESASEACRAATRATLSCAAGTETHDDPRNCRWRRRRAAADLGGCDSAPQLCQHRGAIKSTRRGSGARRQAHRQDAAYAQARQRAKSASLLRKEGFEEVERVIAGSNQAPIDIELPAEPTERPTPQPENRRSTTPRRKRTQASRNRAKRPGKAQVKTPPKGTKRPQEKARDFLTLQPRPSTLFLSHKLVAKITNSHAKVWRFGIYRHALPLAHGQHGSLRRGTRCCPASTFAFLVYATIALGSTDVGSVLHDVSPGPGDGQNSQPWLIIGASAVAILVGLAVTLAASFLPKSTPSRPPQ